MKKILIGILATLAVVALIFCLGEPAQGTSPGDFTLTKIIALLVLVVCGKLVSILLPSNK